MLRWAVVLFTLLIVGTPAVAKEPVPASPTKLARRTPPEHRNAYPGKGAAASIHPSQLRVESEPVAKVGSEVDVGGPVTPQLRARRYYEKAAQAFSEGRNADAITLFRRANDLVPDPRFSYNIGLAYEDMGDSGRALQAYREYLRAVPEAGDRQDVDERIDRLQVKLGELGVQQVTVTSQPEGAVLSIGGKPVGVTPWTGELPLGTVTLRLARRGYYNTDLDVELGPQQAVEVKATMTKAAPPVFHTPRKKPKPQVPKPWIEQIQPATWSFAAGGTAAIAGGVVFEVLRSKNANTADTSTDVREAQRANRAATATQAASLTLLGTGVVLWGVSGVLLGFDLAPKDKKDATKDETASRIKFLAADCSKRFCGVRATGSLW